MKYKQFLSIVVCSAILFVAGCSNNVYSLSYSSINSAYAQQLDQITPGMTKSEVRQILPDLVARGQNISSGQNIEALELQHNYWAGVGGQLVRDRLWFYFQNGKLVKWGQPNDWPQKADLVIENRIR